MLQVLLLLFNLKFQVRARARRESCNARQVPSGSDGPLASETGSDWDCTFQFCIERVDGLHCTGMASLRSQLKASPVALDSKAQAAGPGVR